MAKKEELTYWVTAGGRSCLRIAKEPFVIERMAYADVHGVKCPVLLELAAHRKDARSGA